MKPLPTSGAIAVLRRAYSVKALQSITSALHYLNTLGEEFAQRFNDTMNAALLKAQTDIAGEIAENGEPFNQPDKEATAHFAETVYRLSLNTSKYRSRGTSRGLWYLYYVLQDLDDDGIIDTLTVAYVRHSASRPLDAIEESDATE